MIDLTVKTLDSQNHAFSLSDDITVREFKEHIAETVGVPADSQRLIYCGRVLQDEKRLNEYDVNGKVIHLVQRAPPQSAQRGNSGGQSQNRGRGDQQPPRMRPRQATTQFHGNPMYLGSFSIPAEVVDGHEWAIPQLSNTLSNSRLVVARRMLDQANRVLDRLENPTAATAANDTAAPETEESTNSAGTANSTGQHQDEAVNRTERFLQQLTGPGGPMGGLFEFATAIAGSARPTYVWSSRTSGGESAGNEPSAPAAETSDETPPSSQDQQSQQQQSRQGSANSSNDSPGNARTGVQGAPPAPRPPQMAQLLGRLMDTQDRLRPFLTRYRELMDLDPEIPGGRNSAGEDIGTVEDNQRIADGVTECFHFLSHANHALSDIIVDMGQQPPRNLRCRPMLIQHSAILQSGIPIQVEARISVARNDASNGESGEESSDAPSRPPTSATATPPTSQRPAESFMGEHGDQAPSAEGQQTGSQQPSQNQPQPESPFGAIFNITNNMEVLMEMGPPESSGPTGGSEANGTGTEQSQTNGGNNNNNNNNNNNAPGTSGVAGIFPWGPAPPPEVIRNLMHVVAGYMAQSAAAVTTVAPTTSTATPTTCIRQRVVVGGGGGAAPNPVQSTQARSNVGTHPTTSTQTRSTPRPHVFHPHPLGVGVGMGQNLDFDPFLPCNSHHIRRTPSATPTNSAATSSPQQPSAQQQFNVQPSQTSTPVSAAQTETGGPSAPVECESSLSPNSLQQARPSLSLRDEIANLRGSTGSKMNEGETEGIFSLEDVLLSRGINNVLRSRDFAADQSGPYLLRRLLTACSRIEVSEWYAFLETGEFNRDDVWRRLHPHISSLGSVQVGSDPSNAPALIFSELRPYLNIISKFLKRESNVRDGRRINLLATFQPILFRHCLKAVEYIRRNVHVGDVDEWGRGFVRIIRDFGRELCSVLRYSLRREQAGLEALIRNFAEAVIRPHRDLREWVMGSVVEWFCEYTRNVEQLPESQIIPLLAYDETADEDGSVDNVEAELPEETSSQPEPEPMETEEASGNRTINDPLDLDDGQEVPTSFPGHEALLPEWVPIIARDGVRQRRQLQLQGGGVTPFSDAYLDGLPSKRRKLVEQQKPRLLVSPTPNHSSIPASIERLVRESVVRAGAEEADGSAAAVAADPGVRRAFGQAIRDCLNPRRLQTPDFPDARRFPNATRFFTEKDRPPKQ